MRSDFLGHLRTRSSWSIINVMRSRWLVNWRTRVEGGNQIVEGFKQNVGQDDAFDVAPQAFERGVLVDGSRAVVISSNVISENSLEGDNATRVTNLEIQGNHIDTDITGTWPIGNGASGVVSQFS